MSINIDMEWTSVSVCVLSGFVGGGGRTMMKPRGPWRPHISLTVSSPPHTARSLIYLLCSNLNRSAFQRSNVCVWAIRDGSWSWPKNMFHYTFNDINPVWNCIYGSTNDLVSPWWMSHVLKFASVVQPNAWCDILIPVSFQEGPLSPSPTGGPPNTYISSWDAEGFFPGI